MNVFMTFAFTTGDGSFAVLITLLLFVVPLIGIIIAFVRKKDKEETDRANSVQVPPTREKKAPVKNTVKGFTTMQPTIKASFTADDGHVHEGESESYDKIVGSLGEVDGEGCAELDGIRLITHDEAYENSNGARTFDMSAIGYAIVLGQALETPRFKKRTYRR